METFAWTPLFETALPVVDRQHKQLVNLVNQLALSIETASAEHIDETLNALADYAVHHFRNEEQIMVAEGVAAAHLRRHQAMHQSFVTQVVEWIARRNRQETVNLQQLLDFLTNWLIFHILGDDQSLARQVAAIRGGVAPQVAFEQDRHSDEQRTEVLLGALRHLYSDITDRNEELRRAKESLSSLNETLEQRVAERTAELVDVNRRLREEQEKLLDAEKMASLGRMVAGFAHEVNTPIGIAVGAVSHARDLVDELAKLLSQDEVHAEDLDRRMSMLDEISTLTLSNLRRAADMVKSFKRTAVDQASERQREYDLAEVIEDVRKSLQNTFKNRGIVIESSCPPRFLLYGPVGALVQVLTNLFQNSYKHAFAGGTRAGRIHIDASLAGDQVHLEFADDGTGMPEETLQHAFEPFYTTQREAGGSGLGLYIAYNLVTQALRGTIRCESAVGQGTRFVIEIPCRTPAKRVNTQ